MFAKTDKYTICRFVYLYEKNHVWIPLFDGYHLFLQRCELDCLSGRFLFPLEKVLCRGIFVLFISCTYRGGVVMYITPFGTSEMRETVERFVYKQNLPSVRGTAVLQLPKCEGVVTGGGNLLNFLAYFACTFGSLMKTRFSMLPVSSPCPWLLLRVAGDGSTSFSSVTDGDVDVMLTSSFSWSELEPFSGVLSSVCLAAFGAFSFLA